MRIATPLLAALLAGTVTMGTVPLAHAAFRATGTATASFTAAQLAPPTTMTATQDCKYDLGLLVSATLVASWTVSASTWATGQRLVVTNAAGSTLSTQELSPTATTATVKLPLVNTGPYTASVRATYSSWTSPAATATSAGC